jgi:hypothetical protein
MPKRRNPDQTKKAASEKAALIFSQLLSPVAVTRRYSGAISLTV